MGILWGELFPTKLTFGIFLLYMALFVGQGIFVTASQESNNSYNYNTVTVVLLTEVLKLFVSTTLYCKENPITSLLTDIRKDVKVMMLYFIPALLYCLYNNLAFINLSTFDPTTYYLLLQLRVVVTGVLFQIIFKKHLTKRQWLSLILLTFGCMLKQLDLNVPESNNNSSSEHTIMKKTPFTHSNLTARSVMKISQKNTSGFDFSISGVLILAQTVFSCLAGVYNEYLLKDKGAEVNIFVQNVFMYLDSIVCNMLVLLFRGELFAAFTWTSLQTIFRYKVILIIVNNAAIGIVTSFFLKYMNSILKTFASALELLFTAILCYVLFAIPIYLNTALAIVVVSLAIYLYSQCPVVNTGVGKIRPLVGKSDFHPAFTNSNDKQNLLDTKFKADIV